jgi:homogentisate 1,2-dioxygenase
LTDVRYQSGFANHFSSEALPGVLPIGQNSPQKVANGLYAEQISGSAFTAPRHENLRTWAYRIRPSVLQSRFEPFERGLWRSRPFQEVTPSPEQMRWDPIPALSDNVDFVEGVITMAGNGSDASWRGSAAHVFLFDRPMSKRFFYNADGEMLLVLQKGAIEFRTELGVIHARPGEIVVIPRGIKFAAWPLEGSARGYICENYGPPLRLPQLGPIGANGLANPRDFESPVAAYDDSTGDFELIAKFQGNLWRSTLDHSALDVVAWHGNYAPYKYDLSKFQAVNAVNFDHSDPSIFTVLTSPSELPGTANVDFVIFPPRWIVSENTFRPPYFHRNCMSEFMGLIFGTYEAKEEGFVPGGASLHNCMSAHGPDADTFERASNADLKPQKLNDTLAFMFESSLVFAPTKFAAECEQLQKDYLSCWRGLPVNFKT